MINNHPYYKDLRHIIAADLRCSTITPEDDQIWELESTRGEPPGLAFQTTYGLRAYGIRVFPRFSINKVPVSNPHSFSTRPVIHYAAPNYVEIHYLPFSTLDVIQKTWVPDSHTLTSQVGLTNTSADLVQLWMEWIVQLNPLLTGSPMTSVQISVNTVLQGQTGNLFPVFLLTGGPRGDLSAFPSLGIDVTLPPHASRYFSWALATLNNIEDSFYAARKATSYTLDNEQIKIEMLQKGQTVRFDFGDSSLNHRMEESQQRTFQLLLPPYRILNNSWYVTKRNPEHGNLPVENSSGFSADWGIQKMTEIWALSRILLPLKPDLVKGMLQNVLDQQGVDGTVYAQINWNGKVTNLAAAPLAASLAADVFESTGDKEWLVHNYAALIRALKIWFQPENDHDQDGWPEWQHLLQTALADNTVYEHKTKLEVLIKTAEWPSLAALLLNECRALIKMTKWLNDPTDLDWLESQVLQLGKALEQSWDQNRRMFLFRDQAGHFSARGKVLHNFRQNGVAETISALSHPCRLVVRMQTREIDNRTIVCQIKGVINHHEKTITYSDRDCYWEDHNGLAVGNEIFSKVKKITVNGLKKGESLIVETPDHFFQSAEMIIPLWAGVGSKIQTEALIKAGKQFMDSTDCEIPFYVKIMWLEALMNTNHKDLASQYFKKWFLGFSQNSADAETQSASNAHYSVTTGLEQLLPLKTILQLLGIERISDEELILDGFNDFFPKVNVQYKKFKLDLESGQARVENLNGESVLITEPGPHRIKLS